MENAVIESMSLHTEDERTRNNEVNQRPRETADDTLRQLNARVDPAATQEQIARYTVEMATAKVEYGHHITGARAR